MNNKVLTFAGIVYLLSKLQFFKLQQPTAGIAIAEQKDLKETIWRG